MANVERAYLELDDALFRHRDRRGGLPAVRELLHLLRRCTDADYPNVPPPERLGHEFARDALAMLDALQAAPPRLQAPVAEARQDSGPAPPTAGQRWQALFPAGTELDLSPFEADAVIRRRRAQVRELDDEIALLSRRVDRLRGLPVRMQ